MGYLQSLAFEHHMEKHRFWTNLYRRHVSSKQDLDIKSQVQSIVWTYRLIPLSIFIFGAVAILKMTGVDRMSLRKRGVAVVVAAFISDIFVRTRKSSEIFYLIPEISEPKLEA
uniref:Predicted protein n=1 Tax=Hordeum vulgare subsp. vulgare TaxID=112509 RepID=F2DTL4_HORVV|nr:predicted protein [Hordeum vulgare subsp. vulgare]